MESLSITISSTGPMLMHSAVFANPIDKRTQAHKELTSKRKKTEEDHLAIAKSEWLSSFYCDPEVGPYIPGTNIESCLFEAAKFKKLGKTAKRAIFVKDDVIKLEYKGPRDPEAMYSKPEFIDVRAVKVGTAKIMRYRPKFNEWTASFELMFNPEQINRGEMISIINDAGSLIGLGDFRPRFGKFSVEVDA